MAYSSIQGFSCPKVLDQTLDSKHLDLFALTLKMKSKFNLPSKKYGESEVASKARAVHIIFIGTERTQLLHNKSLYGDLLRPTNLCYKLAGRRGRDSNSRSRNPETSLFESDPFNHSGTSPLHQYVNSLFRGSFVCNSRSSDRPFFFSVQIIHPNSIRYFTNSGLISNILISKSFTHNIVNFYHISFRNKHN